MKTPWNEYMKVAAIASAYGLLWKDAIKLKTSNSMKLKLKLKKEKKNEN